MKSDPYTKIVLSVIAACLVWICVNNATPTAAAQTDPNRPQPVIIVNERGQPLITSQGLRVNSGSVAWPVVINQTIPVTLTQTIPVTLTAIDRRGAWQPIQVDVMKAPSTPMPTP
jgi:hypothetical protein